MSYRIPFFPSRRVIGYAEDTRTMLPVRVPAHRLARHGMLATAVLLGLALVLITGTAWRDAEALSGTVSEGQSEIYLRAMHNRAHERPPRTEDLEAMVAELADAGLRGIGVVETDGSLHRIAGTLTEKPIPGGGLPLGRYLRRVGDRYQIIAPPVRRPPPHGGKRRRPPPPAWMPPPLKGPPPPLGEPPEVDEVDDGVPDGKPLLVFEFEPLLASGLLDRARQTFFLATGTALLLVSAALVLARRAAREDALAARLAQKERLASLGTMSAVLAHEIKNPLAALKGNAQLVSEALAPESRARGQADRVVEAAVRLQGLVQNLLDFARGGVIERVETDPAELLFLAAEDAAPSATLELDDAPPTWSLDTIRMRQVLENLLRNAAQASQGGAVTARVSVEDDNLVYVVRDDGPGFPPEVIETAFEPFVTTKTRGVGLGLAVARTIVAMHGGEIVVKNRIEGGAEVRVSIPRARG